MKEIKAVIFDMDGVITETSEMHYLAWKAMASAIDIEIDLAFNEKLKGISRRDSLMRILEHGHAVDQYTEEEIQQMMTSKNDHYVSLIEGYTAEQLNDGIYDFMKTLKEHEIKIAIASASKSAPMLVNKLGIEDLVDYIVDPTTVPGKPAPDIFSKAAEIFSLSPEVCIGVEDAVAGVEAIKSAGMFAVGIGQSDILSKADVVFNETNQLTYANLLIARQN